MGTMVEMIKLYCDDGSKGVDHGVGEGPSGSDEIMHSALMVSLSLSSLAPPHSIFPCFFSSSSP